ncbi:unnamed protein product [Thelazia callipaeda]|uniref:Cation_ATPase_N domain-containing protein n=1 Tax=Thelazia callipaeda TaxID=103827 RepID=A0A0N5D480_THECL|nr:unnamed protein product [Thelazia callipaeda]
MGKPTATADPVDVSVVVHHQLLKELELGCNFFEHTLTLEQLRDLYPLSRICLENPELSKGLNKDEAASRLATDGRNVIFAVSGRAAIQMFLEQFSHTFRLMLLTAALTCFIIYSLDTTRYIELYLAITLIIIFFILCGVSYWQERSAKQNMRGFQSMITSYCFVVRATERMRISAADIVVGDIVYLWYLFQVIGKIVQMISKEKGAPTRLEIEHKCFVNFISLLAVTMATITFIVGLLLTSFQRITSTLVNGFLVIIIANIPQGLPITLGAALVIVARRLAKQNVFMKRLDVVETLGTATVVMCDKTGVFTLNDITVSDLWYQLQHFKGTEELKAKRKHVSPTQLEMPLAESNNNSLVALLTVMSVCSKAHLQPINSRGSEAWQRVYKFSEITNTLSMQSLLDGKVSQNKIYSADVERTVRAAFHHKVITGNENEVALLKYVEEIANAESLRKNYEILFEVPFNRQRRFQMMVVRQRPKNDGCDLNSMKQYVFLKGAPEELFMHCKMLATEEGYTEISDSCIAQFSVSPFFFS